MSQWFAVKITAEPRAADAIEHCLNELDALGTEIDQLRKKPDEDVTVVGYFSDLPDVAPVEQQLDAALPAFDLDRSAIKSVDYSTVEDQDWLSEWK